MPSQSKLEDLLLQALLDEGFPVLQNVRVSELRRWRFDLADVHRKVAIEIDGMFHGSAKQRASDAEKANYAVEHGWRVLRYPASRVATKKRRERIVEQIKRVLCGVECGDSAACVLTGE